MSIRAIALKARLSVRQRRVSSFLDAAVRHAERADWIEEVLHRARKQGWQIPEKVNVTSDYLRSHEELRALAALQRACDFEDETIRGLLGADALIRG